MSALQTMNGSVNIELSNKACNIFSQKSFQLEVSNGSVVQQIKERIQSLTKIPLSHILVVERPNDEYFVDVIVHEIESCEECKKISEIFKNTNALNQLDKELNSGVLDFFLLNIF